MAQEYGPPQLVITGTNAIGGYEEAALYAPGGMDIMSSITWNIPNAVKSQSYQVQAGYTTALPGSFTENTGGGISNTVKPFYWGSVPGPQTVTVQVTYSDGSTTQAQQTVDVGAPTVNSFSVSQTQTVWAQNAPIPGGNGNAMYSALTYAANVYVPITCPGGIFSLLQLVSTSNSITDQTDNNDPPGTQLHTISCPGYALDNAAGTWDPANGLFYMGNSTQQAAGPGNTVSLLSAGTPTASSDFPQVSPAQSKGDVGCIQIQLDDAFMDYLLYQPTGGIWVQVAETPSFTVTGTGTPDANGNFIVTNASPADTTQGFPSLAFVSWDDYYANNPNYEWTPPFTN